MNELCIDLVNERIQQVIETLKITDKDNIKTRLINYEPQNKFVDNLNKKIRSQWETYNYFNDILD